MRLKAPFTIGSRLLPALRIGGAELSIDFVGVRANRCVWRWYVDIGGAEYSEADLSSPTDDVQAAFGALLAFLDAASESLRFAEFDGREIDDDDNASLFPRPVVEWARENSDELGILRLEIEESGEVLIDDVDD